MSPRPTSWPLLVALVAPFAAVIVWLAAATHHASLSSLPEDSVGLLWPFRGAHRVVIFDRSAAIARVLDAAGGHVGEVRPPADDPPTALLPLEARGQLLWLVGRRPFFEQEAVVAALPLAGGKTIARSYRLPSAVFSPVQASRLSGDEAALELPRPLALLCGERSILLRTRAGWARLDVKPGERRRRGGAPRPELAPIVADVAGGCQELRRIPSPELVPASTALFAEIWRGGRPMILTARHRPPRAIALVGPDRRRSHLVQPPRELEMRGAALLLGRWLLIYGRSCELGELRLALGDLESSARDGYRWVAVLHEEAFAGCAPDLAPAASICECERERTGEGGAHVRLDEREVRLRIVTASGPRLWRARTGERLPDESPCHCASTAERPEGASSNCRPMTPLRRDAPYWEGGRTLEQDGVRYRIEEGPPRLVAHKGGQLLWSTPLVPVAPTFILGATADSVLLVRDLSELQAFDRASGARRLSVRWLGAPSASSWYWPGRVQWLGATGARAYWLVHEEQTRLGIFDGRSLRLAE